MGVVTQREAAMDTKHGEDHLLLVHSWPRGTEPADKGHRG